MSSTPSAFESPTSRAELREIITSALRYWEPRRLIYNAVLAAVAGAHWLDSQTDSEQNYTRGSLGLLFLLAAGANLCYCAAYPVDVFVQQSDFRGQWLRSRWVLFVLGTLVAAVLTHFIARPFFHIPAGL